MSKPFNAGDKVRHILDGKKGVVTKVAYGTVYPVFIQWEGDTEERSYTSEGAFIVGSNSTCVVHADEAIPGDNPKITYLDDRLIFEVEDAISQSHYRDITHVYMCGGNKEFIAIELKDSRRLELKCFDRTREVLNEIKARLKKDFEEIVVD